MTYSSEVLADSPLVYWRLGETSGTAAVDASGNGRDGVYNNSPTQGVAGLVVGDSNTAVQFDGTNDSVSMSAWASWMAPSSWTCEIVAKLSTVSGTQTLMCEYSVGNPVAGSRFTMRMDAAKVSLYVFTGSSWGVITSNASLAAGVVYHLVATYDGTTAKLYINGVLDKSQTLSVTPNSTTYPLSIGSGSNTTAERLTGVLDEAAFYGTVLSAARVSAHYAELVGPYHAAVIADTPLAWWRMGGASSATITDSSGNARNGDWQATPQHGVPSLLGGGVSDTCVDLDGSSQFGRVLYSSTFMDSTSNSWEFLIQPESIGAAQSLIEKWDGWTAMWTVGITAAGKLEYKAWDSGGSLALTLTGATTLVAGQTYHVMVTTTSGAHRIYLTPAGGATVVDATSSAAFTLKTGNCRVSFGAHWDATSGGAGTKTQYYNGRLDEVAWYGSALSQARAEAHATAASLVSTVEATNSYLDAVRADSPLFFYRLAEAYGSVALDASGNHRSGDYVNNPSLGAAGLLVGSTNKAVSLDGVNDYVSRADAAWLDVSTITIEAIIKPSSLVRSYEPIMCRDGYGSGGGGSAGRSWSLMLGAYASVYRLTFSWWDGSGALSTLIGSIPFVAGTIYHVVATYDGTTAKLYVNGVLDNSMAYSGVIQTGAWPVQIGGYLDAFALNRTFPGIVDEAAMYGAALSAARVKAHSDAAFGIGSGYSGWGIQL